MSHENTIKERLKKNCSVCARKINLIVYQDRTYRGGHFFGKIPLFSNKALRKAMEFGTHASKLGGATIQVMNRGPKPQRYEEYWECPRCYWRK